MADSFSSGGQKVEQALFDTPLHILDFLFTQLRRKPKLSTPKALRCASRQASSRAATSASYPSYDGA